MPNNRSYNLSPSPNIPTETMFLEGSGLNVLPFTTSYKMTPDPDFDCDSCSVLNRFTLTAVINSNNVNIAI